MTRFGFFGIVFCFYFAQTIAFVTRFSETGIAFSKFWLNTSSDILMSAKSDKNFLLALFG